ncbi:MAG: alpha-amylase family glycosyl hydrolase [Chloroflexota bacterium]|nr:alpha-amylase family glycosyl hydrolase [Chloroflexota bacterium]
MPSDRKIKNYLALLYGERRADLAWQQLSERLAVFAARYPGLNRGVRSTGQRLTEKDAILITYGDQFLEPDRAPLETLHRFLRTYLADVLSGVHILPCFPFSSDDGFSVIDYMQIDPNLGTWADIDALSQDFRLMLDAVINHISRQSAWFQAFLQEERPYSLYFIRVDPETDLSNVVRPRALPLLTPVETIYGTSHVWTTFSDDQIDLNYADPQVLLEIIDVLLHYVSHGAEFIRLDAIAYLWKEIGTSCIHLPQTHLVVKLWRAVLDMVAPGVMLITETNVPHEENISYFGDAVPGTGSTDEAQMVYNFSLAPLTLHALQTGDALRLSRWASMLKTPVPGATFFNFIASHDGIGVRPAEGILTADEVQRLVDQTIAHGGQVSYKDNPDGTRNVYELNTTLYDFLNDPRSPDLEIDVNRFLASQAILLSLAGVPGIYVHSLFGSRNCRPCYEETGRSRSLNREKFECWQIEEMLADQCSHCHHVYHGVRQLLQLRREHSAFHPASIQEVLALSRSVFGLIRSSLDGSDTVICLINVSDRSQEVDLSLNAMSLTRGGSLQDLVSQADIGATDGRLHVVLQPYQIMWLTS